MPRKPRIHFEGALYHVIVRGNNKEHIFADERDKKEYFEIIKRYKKKYCFILYAYCILSNHAHILMEVREVPLSKVMQGIQQVYTQRYNKRKNRTGHVFEQRYKAILCSKDEYLLQLIRYIHQNPVRSGFKEGINYKWSSHREYIGDKEIVDIEYPLSVFSSKKKQAVKIYLEYIMDSEKADVIGLEEGVDKEVLTGRKFEANKGAARIEPDRLIHKAEEVSGIEFAKIYGNSKNRNISDLRKVLVELLHNHTDLNNKEIATKLGIGQSAVTNILNGRYKNREYVNQLSRRIIDELKCEFVKPDPKTIKNF